MIKVNLVGNPNTGKTTLYNSLTSAHEHVGNWHGVTVQEKVRRYKFKNEEIEIADLPGIYSLTGLSYEEKVGVDYILNDPQRLIINICDASNLQRNLYLTLGLIELGANVILAINQIEKVPIRKIDYKKLSSLLGIPVVAIDAGKRNNLEEINKTVLSYKGHSQYTLPYLKTLPLEQIKLPENHNRELSLFYKIKLLENDENILKKLSIDEKDIHSDIEGVAKARYDYIQKVLNDCTTPQQRVYGRSKLDKVLMNRFLALPIFICFLALAFYITFFSVGAWCSDGLIWLLDKFVGTPLIAFFTNIFGGSSWVVGLVEVAIVGGVGSILSFLPQVALLFLCLSVLEDSGYLARVAFGIEDILGKVGLSGKSVYTLLMGFGCSTTAVLTARNMEDKNAKIKTGLLTPYMSCSAKFPIYAVLGGAFFGASNIFVILGLYLLGVVVAILLSYIFEKSVLKSKEQTFILEFPPYHSMNIKRIFSVLWENVRLFLTRVGTLLISMNIIIWLLGNFTFTLSYIPSQGGESILEVLGKVLAPIFIPLGFGNWALTAALIAGLVAKEVIVSSVAMFNNVDESSNSLIGESVKNPANPIYFSSPSSVISYLVFCLLYFPCLATASVLSKEIGKKWTIVGIIVQFLVAYLVTFVIYTIARSVEALGLWQVVFTLAGIIAIIVSFVVVIKKIKKKKTCTFCHNCDKSCLKNKKMG